MKVLTDKGFSLIEILVASTILALSIMATVSMVRKAQELSTLDEHRRKARGFIDGLFETPTYQQMNYASLNPTNASSTVTLDSISLSSKISAQVKTVISAIDNTTLGANGPFKKVTISVKWKEFGVTGTTAADTETVSIEKWISP